MRRAAGIPRKVAEFLPTWVQGPAPQNMLVFREYGRTVDVANDLRRGAKPRWVRNIVVSRYSIESVMGSAYWSEWHAVSVEFYADESMGSARYWLLFYDFDNEEDPRLAVEKGVEFAESLRRRFGAEPVLVRSGFKGLHVYVVLSRPLETFDDYRYVWGYLVQPYRLGAVLDRKVCSPRRLARIPYTHNVKVVNGEVIRRRAVVVDRGLRPIDPSDFSWDSYEPLDLSTVPSRAEVIAEIPRFRKIYVGRGKNKLPLPDDPAELDNHGAVPPCIRSIIRALKSSGDPDHYQRMALVLYLKWVGYGVEEVVDLFRRHAKDFKERFTRYQVEYLYGLKGKRIDWLMYSCVKMKELGMCLNCGWDRNPVTYTYVRAAVPEEVRQRFFNLVKNRVGN